MITLAACGGGAADPASPQICVVETPTPGATAELGTGTVDFEPVVDGQELPIHTGPQGGHHVIAHARMSGLDVGDVAAPGDPANPNTTFCAFREDGTAVHLQPISYDLGYVAQGDAYVLPTGRFLLLQDAIVDALYGQRLRLTVAVRDDSGRAAFGEHTIVAVPLGEESDALPPRGDAALGPDAAGPVDAP